MDICCCSVAFYGEKVMLAQMIRKWCQQFKAWWELIDDEPRAGCSTELHTHENRHWVEKLILSNHWVTVTELEASSAGFNEVSNSSIYSQTWFSKDLWQVGAKTDGRSSDEKNGLRA